MQAAGLGLALAMLAPAGPTRLNRDASAAGATSEWVVTDENSGLALFGFDPVGYFTEAQAVPGRPEFELIAAGAIWRFRNEGNRAAFRREPDLYRPQFGGYDPVAVMQGRPLAGHPSVWIIVHDRLYLFRDRSSLAAFAADPAPIIAGATAKWPSLLRILAP